MVVVEVMVVLRAKIQLILAIAVAIVVISSRVRGNHTCMFANMEGL